MRALCVVLLACAQIAPAADAQPRGPNHGRRVVDTLVEVGSYRLHFRIVDGVGAPVLFEAGGGDRLDVWNDMVDRVAAVVPGPLIAYDRAGFGTSGMDTTRRSIDDQVVALNTGLIRLGIRPGGLVVAHSLGGFFAARLAALFPRRVRAVVLVDASTPCFWTPARLRAIGEDSSGVFPESGRDTGLTFLKRDYVRNANVVIHGEFFSKVRVLDIVSERTWAPDSASAADWRRCHAAFVASENDREAVIAFETGHYVQREAPELVAAAIARAYAYTGSSHPSPAALNRSSAFGVHAIAETIRREARRRRSEDDLNSWGYELLASKQFREAIAVFQTNVTLHPKSSNAFDSLADGYEANGNVADAVRALRQLLEIEPDNARARARIDGLLRK
jgi:pimeloyl-ACP methyl ester carboxylesterase